MSSQFNTFALMLDCLIVGLGLAGISFCEQLEKNNKSFMVISDSSQTSSLVAGGLYNPVVLKRFTLAWEAHRQLEIAMPFYTDLEKKLEIKLNHRLPVYRRFNSPEEQNRWFDASDKKGLATFLSTEIHPNRNPHIDAPFGYGEVLGTGRIDTKKLVIAYKKFLLAQKFLLQETFDFSELDIKQNSIRYRSFEAKQVVFSEGFGLSKNPFFKYLPLKGSKGEYLFIQAPDLKERNAIKASVFIIPEGEDRYRIGAGYDRNDKTNQPTVKGREELLKKLYGIVKCDFKILGQVAGVRPTVVDRRPLAGRHPDYQNLYVLNGLGSRGVMIAPFVSKKLYDYIAYGLPLDKEIDIARFANKYFRNGPSSGSHRTSRKG